MLQTQFITSVLDWEHRLEIEDERRANHRYEPYVNYLAPVASKRKPHKSNLAWFARPRRKVEPVYAVSTWECCQES